MRAVVAGREPEAGPHGSDPATALRGTLAIYVDVAYRETGGRVYTNSEVFGFLQFACAVGARFEDFVLIGRRAPDSEPTDHPLPAGARCALLPHYGNLRQLRAVLRAVPGTLRGMWRSLAGTDVVWVFGPHPFALAMVPLALLRRRRVVLGARQDTMSYFRSRLPSPRWRPLLAPLAAMDWAYRLLARRLATTVVGTQVAARYGSPRPNLLPITVSLLRDEDVAPEPPRRDWSGTVHLLTVGRVEPEKNPLLLVEALARLERARPGRYAATWIGDGRLVAEMRSRAEALGVGERLELPGFVPFGEPLLERYRGAHMFVHVALTEGVPQVLLEALGCGTPIVATGVGGVAAALDGGAAGRVVPPADLDALVAAILDLSDHEDVRLRLATRGLELARQVAIGAESARVARFVAGVEGP